MWVLYGLYLRRADIRREKHRRGGRGRSEIFVGTWFTCSQFLHNLSGFEVGLG